MEHDTRLEQSQLLLQQTVTCMNLKTPQRDKTKRVQLYFEKQTNHVRVRIQGFSYL